MVDLRRKPGHQKLQYFRPEPSTSCVISPASKVSSAVSLQIDGSLADLSVSNSLQPTSDRLLDLDAGCTELICPELLQIGYLTGSEEDLCLTKLEHVWVLRNKMKMTYIPIVK